MTASEPVGVAEYEFEHVSAGDSAVILHEGRHTAATVTGVRRDDMGETTVYEVCTYNGSGNRLEADFTWITLDEHIRVYENYGDATTYAAYLNGRTA